MRSYKHKIYLAALVWVVLCLVMFFYVFNLMGNSNRDLTLDLAQRQHEMALLQAEQESYQKAQEDLAQLQKMPLQPENLFSKDVTFVNEIRTLEDITAKNNVKMVLGGVSGTIQTSQKAKTTSKNLFVVPFSLSLTGTLANVVSTLEVIEHLPFVVSLPSMTVSAAGNGNVAASLTGSFYLEGN